MGDPARKGMRGILAKKNMRILTGKSNVKMQIAIVETVIVRRHNNKTVYQKNSRGTNRVHGKAIPKEVTTPSAKTDPPSPV